MYQKYKVTISKRFRYLPQIEIIILYFRLQDEYTKSKYNDEGIHTDSTTYTDNSDNGDRREIHMLSESEDVMERIKYQQEVVDLERKVTTIIFYS